MGLSNWLYTNTTKQVLNIVHPAGHAELHDSLILAADVILRNPRCCVAHPYVFQQPWAIVSPDTALMPGQKFYVMPGQKFYVVPITTIRRLQKLSLKFNPSHTQQVDQNNQDLSASGGEDMNSSRNADKASFCTCLRGKKIKGKNSEDSSKERFATNLISCKTRAESKKRGNDINVNGGPPKRLIALDNWHQV